MKQKTCCFTGHRDIPLGDYQLIFDKTEEMVERLIKKGYLYFGAGGALGFDTIAALAVLKLKEHYPDIRLILVLPCRFQTRGWASAMRISSDMLIRLFIHRKNTREVVCTNATVIL